MEKDEALKKGIAYFSFLKSIGIEYVEPTLRETAVPSPVAKAAERQSENPATAVRSAETPRTFNLSSLQTEVEACVACGLHKTRNMVVFGTGNPQARIMFVGEAPGEEEDKQGKPFVGRAGNLLTKMIAAIGFQREEVFIANVLKCRPPGNRDPKPDEVAACEHFLIEQIKAVKPVIICALGTHAAQTLLKTDESIGNMRGKLHDYHGVPLIPTYHPSFLLRSPNMKKLAWVDLQMLRDEQAKRIK